MSNISRSVASGVCSPLCDQVLEGLLVMTWDDLPPSRPFQLLESLSALEPRWMVPCQPPLWDPVTPLHISAINIEITKMMDKLTFSMTWQWSLMKRKVPLSAIFICIPIKPVAE